MQRRINLQNYKALAVLFQISYSSYKVKVSINLVFFSIKYFVLVVIQSRKKKKEKKLYYIFAIKRSICNFLESKPRTQ